MTLADLGATVIKVESLEGDDTRTWGPPFIRADDASISAYFACTNRNKQSIAVDLKHPEGLALVQKLAAQADVVVENFKTGGAEKLGLGYDALKALNPKLVYCSISGYGRTGPWKDKAGYDFIIQAEGGVMSITGPEDGTPFKVGVAIADITTGMNATMAIMAALIARGRTGEGQHIDISLFESQLQWLANVASNSLFTGNDAKRWGNAHPNIVPYQAFAAQDGWFALAVGNDGQWAKLCTLLGKPEWAAKNSPYATNPQRVQNRKDLIPQLTAVFATQPITHWLTALDPLGVPCGRVNSVAQALDHAVTAARGLRQTMAHPAGMNIPVLGSPLHLSQTPVHYHSAPPLTGQHTAEILKAHLGLDAGQIAALQTQGVVK